MQPPAVGLRTAPDTNGFLLEWGESHFLGESQSRFYPHMRAKFGRGPTSVSKKVYFKFISTAVDSIALRHVRYRNNINQMQPHQMVALYNRKMADVKQLCDILALATTVARWYRVLFRSLT